MQLYRELVLLEAQLKTVADVFAKLNIYYRELLEKQKSDFPFAEADKNWLDDALIRLEELENLIRKWQEQSQVVSQTGFASRSPLDEEHPILRVTPDL